MVNTHPHRRLRSGRRSGSYLLSISTCLMWFQLALFPGTPLIDEATDPHVTSREQLSNLVARFEAVRATLMATDETDHNTASLKRAVTRFLDFAGGGSDTTEIVVGEELVIHIPREMGSVVRDNLLDVTQDVYAGVIEQWRARIATDPPAGFVFIKIYADRETMMRNYDLGPDVAGVAFPCRFIAVALASQQGRLGGRVRYYIMGDEYRQTLAHELIHAFTFMSLGADRAGVLPRWFMEGVALEFSGARPVRSVIEGPGGTVIRDFDSTEEYRGFKRLFQFIQEKYGRERLDDFVKATLKAGSVAPALPGVLGLADETTLIGASVTWRREKERYHQRLLVVIASLVCAAGLALRRQWARFRPLAGLLILWLAGIHASRSMFHLHTLLWWVPAALTIPLVYMAIRSIRSTSGYREPAIRLIAIPDWPRLDELMNPWPFEDVDLAGITDHPDGVNWVWGEREMTGSDAWRIREFLDAQPTGSYYFRGRAYRIWYEPV